MQTADEEPIETIHLYVVREEATPSLFPIFLSVFALSALVAISVLFPYQQPETRMTLRVPAVLLPLQMFMAQASIVPTGIKTIPATIAHGELTITNGSVISQTIPQGFRIDNVVTDTSVFVPAGSANGYGYAIVSAHALFSGRQGNIPAYAIDVVVGSSIYIRNLTSFHGGKDSYTVALQLPKDRQTALEKAREGLSRQTRGLHYPCQEVVNNRNSVVKLVVKCQFVSYQIPSYMHVTRVQLIGRIVIVDVWFVVRPQRIWVK